ncbi:hypothetical protein [Leptolyngbya ohadii]|uniref:hypothetical protein n=1 Tax=Leptolyngbya ohadii TaxID=1962290 RepID=UPI00117A29B3|nr:hypothetical protein [Leptolyngbya ohadii]
MTDSRDKRIPPSQPAPGLNPPASKPDESALQITLTLPLDVVAALRRVAQISPNQPIESQIVALLRQALQDKVSGGEIERPLPVNQPKLSQQFNQAATPDPLLQQELNQIKQQLRLLESVLPRLAAMETRLDDLAAQTPTPRPADPAAVQNRSASLPPTVPDSLTAVELSPASPGEKAIVDQKLVDQQSVDQKLTVDQKAADQKGNPGSAVASIWMQVQQSDRPPASIPSTLQSAESCPQCQQRLMPFKSSGVMRCIGCGWNRPLNGEAEDVEGETTSASVTGVPEVDIHRLLERAAAESMENMKPRKRSV